MLFTKTMFRPAATSFCGLVLLACALPHAYAQAPADQVPGSAIEAKSQNAIDNLVNIQQSIELKRGTIRELREQLKQQEDASEKQALEKKIARIDKEITSLQLSFEHIA